MLYIITTTGKCNLKCKYCGGSFPQMFVPYDVKYDIQSLTELINRDREATVVYYGGEPLLNWKFIKELNQRLKVKRIGIQTNGTLVKNLEYDFWKYFDFALLSIDGDEFITDLNRGKGTYKKVIDSAKYLKGFGKELIARMVVTGKSNIYRDVKHILDLYLFDKVHWQLDVVWDERWDLKTFVTENYLPGIEKLMSQFMENARNGRIIKIVPFLGILSSFYFKKFKYFPCGAGKYSITINSDGRILACPIAVSEEWNNIGLVGKGFKPLTMPQECINCEYFNYCGGRCLYSFMERYWGNEGFKEICDITKKTIDIVLSKTMELNELIDKKIISKDQLRYDPLDDSTEVIP